SAFEDALKHEIFITESIHNLVTLATEEKDYATLNMLQWFVSEQVEEEAKARENAEMFKRVENHPQGLFMVDRALAQRE
ncbi:MAG TPA: ferritin-like domain-containing protein, partial [Candidatus Mcinerneyibacteriales bacterium]|nr:ferritin-like domain-containing protein [Candidatus Mcinerneyibacteriales bacterium]